MSELDKPLGEWSRSELEHYVNGAEFLFARLRELADDLLASWDRLSDAERKAAFRRAMSPTIINLRPLSDQALDALSRMELGEEQA